MGMAVRRHDVLVLVKAKVVWTKSSGIHEQVVGFQFDQTSQEDVAAIKELVATSVKPTHVPKTA